MPRLATWLALGTSLAIASQTDAAERRRWPRWPTEFDAAVAPLRTDVTTGRDQDRVAALLALEAFADPLIEPWIVLALGDPSGAVKREALRICFERGFAECVPSALAIWSSVTEPMLRVAALRVVGIRPEGAGLDALLGALRDDNETMRAQAATVLGSAAHDAAGRKRAAAALLAKLGDLSATVRQNAVDGLAHVGDAAATLAIARLLDDPEPAVRLGAARTLGLIGDAAAIGPLARAIAAPNEAAVVRAMVFAIANLPGEGASEALLAAFDEPPLGLGLVDVAEAIGLRADPEPALLEGLARRVRDPVASRVAVRTLAAVGKPGIALLERERARGLAPELALEIDRLIAADRVPEAPGRRHHDPVAPAPHDPDDSLDARRGAPLAIALADLGKVAAARDWGPQLEAAFARGGLVSDRRVELALAASVGAAARLGRDDRRALATIVRWTRDARATTTDRCLALLALVATDRRSPGIDDAREAAEDGLADPDPRVRACAVVPWRALVRRADDRALLDPDARVRAVAAIAAHAAGPSRTERARLAVLVARDPDGRVRVAAQWHGDRPRATAVLLVHGGALDPSRRWMALRADGGALWMPTLVVGSERLAWLPALPEAAAAAAD